MTIELLLELLETAERQRDEALARLDEERRARSAAEAHTREVYLELRDSQQALATVTAERDALKAEVTQGTAEEVFPPRVPGQVRLDTMERLKAKAEQALAEVKRETCGCRYRSDRGNVVVAHECDGHRKTREAYNDALTREQDLRARLAAAEGRIAELQQRVNRLVGIASKQRARAEAAAQALAEVTAERDIAEKFHKVVVLERDHERRKALATEQALATMTAERDAVIDAKQQNDDILSRHATHANIQQQKAEQALATVTAERDAAIESYNKVAADANVLERERLEFKQPGKKQVNLDE